MAATSRPLTPQQQAIVDHDHGPALVFAVAGAGKTTAMVRRIERLARAQVFAPDRIMATSFSRATVQDIRTALAAWPYCAGVRLQTLHALGYRIMRQARERGYLARMQFDTSDSSDLSRQILFQTLSVARGRKMAYRDELDTLDQEDFLNFVGTCKGNLRYADLERAALPAIDVAAVASQASPPAGFDWYLDLYRLFEEVRQDRGLMTFDDMLLTGWELLVRYPELLAQTRRRYECVLVDEFQDVNLAQSELLDLITSPHRNYMAIGDDDQTIYEWRGADPRFILNFQQRYDAQVYLIDDNFRCKASQVVLANRVIEHNQKRRPKRLGLTQGFSGATFVSFEDSPEQLGRSLVRDVQAALAGGMRPQDIAVLVRIYAQTPYIEHFLMAGQIPYEVVGGVPFYQRPEVVTLLHYLRLGLLERVLGRGQGLSPDQWETFGSAWRNVYNRPKRYLSREWSEQIAAAVVAQQQPLSQVLHAAATAAGKERTVETIRDLAEDMAWLAAQVETCPADQVLRELDARLGYSDYVRQSSGFPETGAGKAANVTAVTDYARDKGTPVQFLEHLAEAAGAHAGAGDADPADRITITTVFRSKGLEWPVVFIPQCNQGTFPFGEPERLEEERRLLYVAITRSKLYLHLHCLRNVPISQFLREAEYRQTLDAVGALQSTLAREPDRWSRQDARIMALYPPRYHLERYFCRWWAVPPETRSYVARMIRELAAPRPLIRADHPPDLAAVWQTALREQQPVSPPPGRERRSTGRRERPDRRASRR